MKLLQISTLALTFQASVSLAAQPLNFAPHMICHYAANKAPDNVEELVTPSKEATKAVQWLAQSIGIEPNFTLMGATFKAGRSPIAYATIQNGKRMIVYDVNVLFTSEPGSMTWGDLMVLAHEMAHHTSGVTATGSENRHAAELEADFGAGHMLSLLGASLSDTVTWPLANLNEKGSNSHPALSQRIKAITTGWQNARAIVNGR